VTIQSGDCLFFLQRCFEHLFLLSANLFLKWVKNFVASLVVVTYRCEQSHKYSLGFYLTRKLSDILRRCKNARLKDHRCEITESAVQFNADVLMAVNRLH